MFFEADDTIKNALDDSIGRLGILQDGIDGVVKSLVTALDPTAIIQDAQQIASSTVEMTRSVLGQGREIGMELSKTMASAREETLKFGVTNEENIALFGAINKELQNTRYLTKEQIVDMQALARTAGLTAEEMSKFVVNFDTLGIGTDKAISHISKLQGEARSLGLNVGQFMRNVGENMKLMASYNFKGGVDGLAKMAAQATSLRIDMSKTASFAEKLMDPSQAIETAAGFQMIGGAIGKLGQPFQLLNMAQTDMAGLQDEIVKMSAAAVTFNESTGEFDIPVTELYRLREVANLTGIGFQELSEMALNSAKKTQKLTFLDGLANIPEEQRELVANLGELKEGRLQIKIPGQDDMKDVAQLTADELDKLSSLQNEMGRSDKEIAARSMTALESMAAQIASLAAKPEAAVLESGQFEKVTESLATSTDRFITAVENEIRQRDLGEGIDLAGKTLIPELSEETAKNVAKGIMIAADKIIENLPTKVKEAFEGAFSGLDTVSVRGNSVVITTDRSNEPGYQNRSNPPQQSSPESVQQSTPQPPQQSTPQPVETNQELPNAVNQNNTNNSNETTNGMNDANLNINGVVTLNLQGNQIPIDGTELAQNQEFVAKLKNALFNLNGQYDNSIAI